MIDLAKLIRTDRGLSINETLIREEVTRIIELEADIANVSSTLWIFGTSKKKLLQSPRYCCMFYHSYIQQDDYLCK